MIRTRDQLVGERNALTNMIRMRNHQFGLIAPEDNRSMTHKIVPELIEVSPSPEFSLAFITYWQVWKVKLSRMGDYPAEFN